MPITDVTTVQTCSEAGHEGYVKLFVLIPDIKKKRSDFSLLILYQRLLSYRTG